MCSAYQRRRAPPPPNTSISHRAAAGVEIGPVIIAAGSVATAVVIAAVTTWLGLEILTLTIEQSQVAPRNPTCSRTQGRSQATPSPSGQSGVRMTPSALDPVLGEALRANGRGIWTSDQSNTEAPTILAIGNELQPQLLEN